MPRGEQPIPKRAPYHPVASEQRFGALRGVVSVEPTFFDTLPDDELATWGQ